MKRQLFLVDFLTRIVFSKRIPTLSFLLLSLDREYVFDNLSHILIKLDKTLPRLWRYTPFMKKFILLFTLFIIFIVGMPTPKKASADTGVQYACILSDDVYFYSSENEHSGIFILPKTYYVKVLSAGERFTRIEYLTDTKYTRTLVGYCLTYQLTFVDYTPVNPYLYTTFDVVYMAENGDSNDEILERLVFTCGYYGEYVIGTKRYAYAYKNGECTYVPYPANFEYPVNTEYEERLSASSDKEVAEGTVNPIQLGVLAVLCLLVPLLTAIILKNNKSPTYDPEE